MVGASAHELAAITAPYCSDPSTVQAALDTLIAGIADVDLLTMLNTWQMGGAPFHAGFPGGGLPFGSGVPVLTGNPADDASAIGAGTGVAVPLPTLSAVAAETTRATAAEGVNAAAVTTEHTRALAAEALLAPKASPALTGTPTAPLQTALDNSLKLAVTQYVDAAVAVETARAEAAELALGGAVTPPVIGQAAQFNRLTFQGSRSDALSNAAHGISPIIVQYDSLTPGENPLGVTGPYDGIGYVDAMKAATPGVIALAYLDPFRVKVPGANTANRQSELGAATSAMMLTDSRGNGFGNSSAQGYVPDPGNSAYQAALVSQIETMLSLSQIDGMCLDETDPLLDYFATSTAVTATINGTTAVTGISPVQPVGAVLKGTAGAHITAGTTITITGSGATGTLSAAATGSGTESMTLAQACPAYPSDAVWQTGVQSMLTAVATAVHALGKKVIINMAGFHLATYETAWQNYNTIVDGAQMRGSGAGPVRPSPRGRSRSRRRSSTSPGRRPTASSSSPR